MGAHISNISAHFRITLIQKKKNLLSNVKLSELLTYLMLPMELNSVMQEVPRVMFISPVRVAPQACFNSTTGNTMNLWKKNTEQASVLLNPC